ncbi:unnamed protein product [Tetraodon nigroviridis]|uniref:(spotted green pufferfish) hypothetical protein n=1 Tax=Tetraodon nigroviridis TaxID=99883 RepID=Q4T9E7_TETNG|nr:unnamed protein product [Tetraodon nigroviridis]
MNKGPLLHQYSQARGSLGACVVKKRNHVDDKDKDGRKRLHAGTPHTSIHPIILTPRASGDRKQWSK